MLITNILFLSWLITFGIFTMELRYTNELIDMFTNFLSIIIMILDNLVMTLVAIRGKLNDNKQQSIHMKRTKCTTQRHKRIYRVN